jgi:hypothetical protein
MKFVEGQLRYYVTMIKLPPSSRKAVCPVLLHRYLLMRTSIWRYPQQPAAAGRLVLKWYAGDNVRLTILARETTYN